METVIKHLQDLGFSDKEAKVYVSLSKLGSAKTSEIARYLGFSRLQVHRTLEKLLNRGFVKSSFERPRKHTVIPIQHVLDMLAEEAKKKIQEVEGKRNMLLEEWTKIAAGDWDEPSARFRIIQGRKNIYRFRHFLFESAKKTICTMTTKNGLIRSVTFGTDDILEECVRRGILVRRISEIDKQNIEAAKKFLKFCELRHTSTSNICRLTIVDDKEVLIYSTTNDDIKLQSEKDVCLWTDNQEFLRMMRKLYDTTWDTAIDACDRIREIETGASLEVSQI
jgi:sugar-specific transcriptional regulator TrmB